MDLTGRVDYYLEPGYVYLSKTTVIVRTVVGSCVAVCLWDRHLRYGAMNHFLHPRARTSREATPQYGNAATTALIRVMLEAGCRRRNLVAQIMGGGFPPGGSGANIGEKNVTMAREVLGRKGIPIVSEDVGGSMGRKVVFDTGTGQSVVFKVHCLRAADWIVGAG
ncbi:MAG: chemotaxis protein CheD [Lentisphaerae bacterium]|nr:chemotaxis protein CheD [Lentisphaerota bacterium]